MGVGGGWVSGTAGGRWVVQQMVQGVSAPKALGKALKIHQVGLVEMCGPGQLLDVLVRKIFFLTGKNGLQTERHTLDNMCQVVHAIGFTL